MNTNYDEIAYRCIVDSSEVNVKPGKVKFTYTDYEKLQDLIVAALENAQKDNTELIKACILIKSCVGNGSLSLQTARAAATQALNMLGVSNE